MSKSRRIIVSATGRERGFTESLAAFPEKSGRKKARRKDAEGRQQAERGAARRGAAAANPERTEAKEGR